MKWNDICASIEAILFAAGESVPAARIAKVLDLDEDSVLEFADSMQKDYEDTNRGIRLKILDGSLQLCSDRERYDFVARALEQRKPPKLSPSALEVLAIVAYFQPVTRAYIDQIRGIDSSYTVSLLAEREIIEAAGRLDAPGRPVLYRTGDNFLRIMDIRSLDELPPLPDLATDEGMISLQNRIEALRTAELEGQLCFDD